MITQEFISYIKNALAQGHTKESLKGPLLGAGWMPADIEEVFKIVVPPAQGPVPLAPKGPIPMPIPTPMTKPAPAPVASPMPSSPVTPAPATPSPQMASPVMPKMAQPMPTMPPITPKAPEPVRPPAPMASPITPPVSTPTSVSMPSMQNKPVTPATPAAPVPLMPKPSPMPSPMTSKPMPNFNGMPMETPVIKKSNSGLLTIFIVFFLLGGIVFAGWYLYRPQIEKLLGMTTETEDTDDTIKTPVATQPEAPAPVAPADQTVVNIPAPTEQPSATPTPPPVSVPDTGNATYSNSYKGNGFSFNYDTDATQTTTTDSLGTYHRINISGGKYPDSLYFFRGAMPSSVNPCSGSADAKTTTINGKTFTYCDSKDGSTRAYVYENNGKSMLINVTTSSAKPETGYVDLGSIVIQ